MKVNPLIRGIDADAYRKAKAAAALRGIPLGRAVSEALAGWAKETDGLDLELEVKANRAFVHDRWAKLKAHKGKAVVIAGGELRGVFETYEKARSFSTRYKVALVFVVETAPSEREIEIGPELEV